MGDDEPSVTLKEYILRILDEREKALNLAFRAQQEALAVATVSLNRELEHLNALREEITDARSQYVTRKEFNAALELITEKSQLMAEMHSKEGGQLKGVQMALGAILSLIAVAGTIAFIWNMFRH